MLISDWYLFKGENIFELYRTYDEYQIAMDKIIFNHHYFLKKNNPLSF